MVAIHRRAHILLTKTVVALVTLALSVGIAPTPTPAYAATALSVKDFGAIGDGVTDDTAAFNKALTASANGVLTVPAGTYVVSQIRIGAPVMLQGAGREATVIRRKPGDTNATVLVLGTRDVHIADLALDGTLANPVGGSAKSLQFDAATDATVSGVRVVNGGGIEVYNGSDRVVVSDSVFDHNENDVVFHASAYGSVTRCVSTGSLNEAFASYEPAGGSGRAHHNQFVGNTITGGWSGVALQRSADNVVRDNRMTNTTWGISVYGYGETGDYSRGNLVTSNTIVGGPLVKSWALQVEKPSHDNVVVGNTVSDWAYEPVMIDAPQTNFVNNTIVRSADAVSVQGSNVTFTDNVVTDSRIDGVRLSGPVDGLRFERNRIERSAGDGLLVSDAVSRSAFVGNTIRDNGLGAGSFGVYALKPWVDTALVGNIVDDTQSSRTQTGGLYLRSGSTIAVVGNTVSGTTQWTAATAGTIVDIGTPASSAGRRWACSQSGVPGTWAAMDAAVEPAGSNPSSTPAPAPAPEPTSTPAPAPTPEPVPSSEPTDTTVPAQPVGTWITISTSATSVRINRGFVLSGILKPGEVGDEVVVYVQKPGSSRWSYSSARLTYAADGTGGAKWYYGYTPKSRGTYRFQARFAGDAARLASVSAQVAVSVR